MSLHSQSQPSPPIRRTKSESTVSTLSKLFPRDRRSFITPPSDSSRKKAIVSIAIRKGLFVFCSVHGVVSSALVALAIVKGKGRTKGVPGIPSKTFRSVLLDIIKSSNTVRLAAWLGLYSYLWTISSAFLRRRPHWLPQWHPFFAGALSGLSLFAQTKEDRREIAPNVFCRGLYSLLMHHPLFKFKHGDIFLFALANAQLAIAFLLHPSTLPAWYVSWIGRVGEMNPRFVQLNRHLLQQQIPARAELQTVYRRLLQRDAQPRTRKNELKVQTWLNDSRRLQHSAPCSLNHPAFDSCVGYNINQLLRTIVSMAPTYAVLHLVPSLIFRSKVLMKAPLQFFFSLFKKTFFSALFIASFASVVQNCFCVPTQLYDRFRIRIAGGGWYAFLGATTGLCLFWEEPKRRGELALYCAPKALYSFWAVLQSAGIVRSLPFGDILVGCLGSGMLMHCFVHEPEKMPGLARGLISQVVDPHTPDRRKKARPGNGERPIQEELTR
ncbi:hypothetical protein CROQUDRAFT_652456 [Cronartium quercuum f. sp. fusiforme G11]|uniref:Transmembrane protein 135 N-terminal domain-containing protein n=1 Tax=Cronartium quercuum f. sp. fusiforme G11 TaxID=708437 RepID=A0A9P6NQQ2_9BASI|nr:hypothetical protein CROQUDRAFT_652456 [Cronartium quercuum f. sp. fusiforme G11]